MKDYFRQITNYYKPSEPIKDSSLFVGRDKEKTLIYKALITPGRNPVIYGVRGIGKTSLINIACGYFGVKDKYIIARHNCSSSDNFNTIFNTFLRKVSENFIPKQIIKKDSNDKSGSVNFPIIKAEAKFTSTNETTFNSITETSITPTFITEIFKDKKLILVIDELDQIKNPDVMKLIADTIKSLSDSNSLTKVILSGVSNSLISLVGNHQSTMRNLVSIEVPRMSENELKNIITNGTTKLKIEFSKDVIKNIIWLSDGLPYFTHLISECLADFLIYSKKIIAEIDDLEQILNNVIENMALKEIVKQNYINTYSTNRVRFYNDFSDILAQGSKAYNDFTKKTILNLLSKFENSDISINQFILEEYQIIKDTTHWHLDKIDLLDIEIILDLMSKKTDMISEDNGQYYFKDSFHKVYTRIEYIRNK